MIADLQAKIRSNWDPPSLAGMGALKKRSVQIRIRLLADGTIQDPQLVSSSGSKPMDESVLKAVATLPFKIMPPKETLDFILDFNVVDQ